MLRSGQSTSHAEQLSPGGKVADASSDSGESDLCSELDRATRELESLRSQVKASMDGQATVSDVGPFGVLEAVAAVSRHLHLSEAQLLEAVADDLGVSPATLPQQIDGVLAQLAREAVRVCTPAAPWTSIENAKLEQVIAAHIAQQSQKNRFPSGSSAPLPTTMPYGQWTRSFPKRTKQEVAVHCQHLLKNHLLVALFGDTGAEYGDPSSAGGAIMTPVHSVVGRTKLPVSQRPLGPRPMLQPSIVDGRVPIAPSSMSYGHRPIYPAMAPVHSGIYPYPPGVGSWKYMSVPMTSSYSDRTFAQPGHTKFGQGNGRAPAKAGAHNSQPPLIGGDIGSQAYRRAGMQSRRIASSSPSRRAATPSQPKPTKTAVLRNGPAAQPPPASSSSASAAPVIAVDLTGPPSTDADFYDDIYTLQASVGKHQSQSSIAGPEASRDAPAVGVDHTMEEIDRVLGAMDHRSTEEELVMLQGDLPGRETTKRSRDSSEGAPPRKRSRGVLSASTGSLPVGREHAEPSTGSLQEIALGSFDVFGDDLSTLPGDSFQPFAFDGTSVEESFMRYFS